MYSLADRKSQQKNHKNTETNYKINKEKMYSLADRQSQQKIIKTRLCTTMRNSD